MKKLMHKTRHALFESCDFLELLMALVVLAALLIACGSLGSSFLNFWNNRHASEAFLTFVGHVFNILIGIEFLKMLCQPSGDTVLEVLMFLVARHMILDHTTVIENLLTIISIGLLFSIKKYISLPAGKENYRIFSSNSDSKDSEPAKDDIQEENSRHLP